MAKLRQGSAPSQGKKKTRLWQGIFALIVVAGVVLAYVLRDRESSSGTDKASTNENLPDLVSTSPTLRDRLVLPARPRNPRPVTLDPNSFSDPEVREAYQAAKDVPEVLEHLPCYCGCFGETGHRNNLDCYHDNHGVTCGVCRAIAIEGQRQHKMGVPVEEIKRIVDERWAPQARP